MGGELILNFFSFSISHVSEGKAKTFRQKREEERKASEAGGNTRAWNTLFMRADTVCAIFASVLFVY